MTHLIELSPELYHILQRQATVLNATVESLVETAVRRNYGQLATGANQVVKVQERNGTNHASLPTELTDELDQLVFFTDAELWQTANTKLDVDDHTRMETLLAKQHASGLDSDELAEADRLADRYERVVLLRAKAAVLLKERGHDITGLGPSVS